MDPYLRSLKVQEEYMEANELTKSAEKMALIRSYYADQVGPESQHSHSFFQDALWTVSTVAMAMTLILIFAFT